MTIPEELEVPVPMSPVLPSDHGAESSLLNDVEQKYFAEFLDQIWGPDESTSATQQSSLPHPDLHSAQPPQPSLQNPPTHGGATIEQPTVFGNFYHPNSQPWQNQTRISVPPNTIEGYSQFGDHGGTRSGAPTPAFHVRQQIPQSQHYRQRHEQLQRLHPHQHLAEPWTRRSGDQSHISQSLPPLYIQTPRQDLASHHLPAAHLDTHRTHPSSAPLSQPAKDHPQNREPPNRLSDAAVGNGAEVLRMQQQLPAEGKSPRPPSPAARVREPSSEDDAGSNAGKTVAKGLAGKKAAKPRTTKAKAAKEAKRRNGRELLTEQEKRTNHIVSEQKRRTLIRSGFKSLSELVPGQSSGNLGTSKSVILHNTVGFIKHLEYGNRALSEQLERLNRRYEMKVSATAGQPSAPPQHERHHHHAQQPQQQHTSSSAPYPQPYSSSSSVSSLAPSSLQSAPLSSSASSVSLATTHQRQLPHQPPDRRKQRQHSSESEGSADDDDATPSPA
ncbi:hypothetical protein HKX48_008082 [Thoreauomyces humboldtii]|nr:hypothetical protein HKX48_008082 [Thoreauomyces humboldtii]